MPVSRVSFCVRGKTIEKLQKDSTSLSSLHFLWCLLPVPRPSADYFRCSPTVTELLPSSLEVCKNIAENAGFFRALAEFYFAAICNPKSNIINVKWPTSQSSAGVNLFLFCFVYFCGVSLCCCVKWSTTCMSRQNWTVNTPVRKPARKQSADSGIYTDKRPKTLLSST